jgi:exopolysaccharide biosynthesis polyprenyl glycosylphosphotransferase
VAVTPEKYTPNSVDAEAIANPFEYQGFLGALRRGLWSQIRLLSIERLCRRHILLRGTYFRLRTLMPALALGIVWLYSHSINLTLSAHALLSPSVSLRNLVIGFFVSLLWYAGTARQMRRTILTNNGLILRGEVRRLAVSSLACGLALFDGVVIWSGLQRAGELGVVLASGLFLGSMFLLLLALGVSAEIFPAMSRPKKVLFIGTGGRADELRTRLLSNHTNVEILGCLDDEYLGMNRTADKYLGPIDQLAGLLKQQPVEVVYIGLPVKSHYLQIQSVIELCEAVGVEVQHLVDIFSTTRATYRTLALGHELTCVGDHPHEAAQRLLKRALDLAVATAAIVATAPAMLAIAIAIKVTSRGPVFFVQQRYGLHRKCFPMFKFRTMVVDAEQRQAELENRNESGGPTFKLKADPRITKVGAFLRRTSMDELPQLFNVLRGEMSLVGPRPLPQRDVSRFDEYWLLRRFSVLPGLTCLWLVRGRSNTRFDEWIRQDLEYIDGWSIGLDVKILFQTIPAVLRGSGAM